MKTKSNISANNNDTEDINNKEKDSDNHLWRTQSATMALLKHAYKKIDNAEQEIIRQEQRIKDLEKLASTDELTGLYNRRGFMMEFERNINRIKRNLAYDSKKQGGLFILFDLNKFKQINDKYGHLAGDECLKIVANELIKVIRNSDTSARFGGDEFVVFLSDMNEENAKKKAHDIRKRINSLYLNWQGKKIPIETSIGVHYYTIDQSFADIYNAADKSLYIDKCK